MACKCTCGGCDCPQMKVIPFSDVACAGAAQVNYKTWLVPANGAQRVTVDFQANNCAAAAAPMPIYFGEVA